MLRLNVALRFGIVSVCSALLLLMGLWLVMGSSASAAAGADTWLPQQEGATFDEADVTVPVTWTQPTGVPSRSATTTA